MDCPRCRKPAVPATKHRCHECRAEDEDDHDAWCSADACADASCEDWIWFSSESACPSCGATLVVEINDDGPYAEISVAAPEGKP